jgi:hypothetical protein
MLPTVFSIAHNISYAGISVQAFEEFSTWEKGSMSGGHWNGSDGEKEAHTVGSDNRDSLSSCSSEHTSAHGNRQWKNCASIAILGFPPESIVIGLLVGALLLVLRWRTAKAG